MLVIKYSSTVVLGKRKLCECHIRFLNYVRLRIVIAWKNSESSLDLVRTKVKLNLSFLSVYKNFQTSIGRKKVRIDLTIDTAGY